MTMTNNKTTMTDTQAKAALLRVSHKARSEGKKFSEGYYRVFRDETMPSPSWLSTRHGTWRKALSAYGITREDIEGPLENSRAHLTELAKTGTPTQMSYEATRPAGTLSFGALAYHEGSWLKAVEAAKARAYGA